MSLGFKSQSVGVRANLCDEGAKDIWSMYSRTLHDILFLIWGQTVADYKMLSFHLSINVIIIVVSFKIMDLCPIALFQQLWNTLYIHLIIVASCSMTLFYVFEGYLSRRKRLWPEHFQVKFFHAHVVYQLKNEFSSTQYFAGRLLKQLFLFGAVFIRFLWHEYSEKTTWLYKHQLLVYCQWNISPIFLLTHRCQCLENSMYCSWPRNSNISG